MHAMSCIVVNAVRNAISFRAYVPETVLNSALRLVPDLDNVALHMLKKHLRGDPWDFDCPHSERVCDPIASKLLYAVEDELERRSTICKD